MKKAGKNPGLFPTNIGALRDQRHSTLVIS